MASVLTQNVGYVCGLFNHAEVGNENNAYFNGFSWKFSFRRKMIPKLKRSKNLTENIKK